MFIVEFWQIFSKNVIHLGRKHFANRVQFVENLLEPQLVR